MSDDFTAEDVGQMARQGDLRAFMRSRMRRPPEEEREFPATAPPQSRADGRPVGAWPTGAHKPGCFQFGLDVTGCACQTKT